MILRTERVTAIRKQSQTVALGEVLEGIVVTGLAGVIDGGDGLRFRRDSLLNVGGIQQEGVGLNVGEHRRASLEDHGVSCGDESNGRGDYLVPRADTRGVHGGMEGRRPAGDGHPVLSGHEVGQRPLELCHLGPRGHPVRAQDSGDRFDVLFVDPVPSVGDVDALRLTLRSQSITTLCRSARSPARHFTGRSYDAFRVS